MNSTIIRPDYKAIAFEYLGAEAHTQVCVKCQHIVPVKAAGYCVYHAMDMHCYTCQIDRSLHTFIPGQKGLKAKPAPAPVQIPTKAEMKAAMLQMVEAIANEMIMNEGMYDDAVEENDPYAARENTVLSLGDLQAHVTFEDKQAYAIWAGELILPQTWAPALGYDTVQLKWSTIDQRIHVGCFKATELFHCGFIAQGERHAKVHWRTLNGAPLTSGQRVATASNA